MGISFLVVMQYEVRAIKLEEIIAFSVTSFNGIPLPVIDLMLIIKIDESIKILSSIL